VVEVVGLEDREVHEVADPGVDLAIAVDDLVEVLVMKEVVLAC